MNQDLLKKIIEESELDEEGVKEKISEKMKEFSGLVSEEGALHLVAREIGLETTNQKKNELKIENIVPGMRKVQLKSKVVDIGEEREFDKDDGSKGKVRNLVLGDETGTIRMPLWNDQTELGNKLNKKDIIKIKNGYSRESNRGNVELKIGNTTEIKKVEDKDFPDVKSTSSGGSYKKSDILGINQENTNYTLIGSVLTIYTNNPFYNSCPKCRRKVKENEGKFECEEHGEVNPEKTLAISGVLDDGTDNIRGVFFRENAEKLLNLKETPESEDEVEKAAEEAIGRKIELKGSARYNDYFNRIEIISDNVKILNPSNIIKEKIEKIGA